MAGLGAVNRDKKFSTVCTDGHISVYTTGVRFFKYKTSQLLDFSILKHPNTVCFIIEKSNIRSGFEEKSDDL